MYNSAKPCSTRPNPPKKKSKPQVRGLLRCDEDAESQGSDEALGLCILGFRTLGAAFVSLYFDDSHVLDWRSSRGSAQQVLCRTQLPTPGPPPTHGLHRRAFLGLDFDFEVVCALQVTEHSEDVLTLGQTGTCKSTMPPSWRTLEIGASSSDLFRIPMVGFLASGIGLLGLRVWDLAARLRPVQGLAFRV